MSRHRIVRSMNYEDEYYDDDDDYSRSLEDNYCISPSTAAQFTWNRERNMNFASYMGVEDVIDEAEEDEAQEEPSLQDSLKSDIQAPVELNDIDQARLNSCLVEIHTILGDTVPKSVVAEVIVKNQYHIESSLNELLTQQGVPKPQREPRNRKNRSQDDNDDTDQLNMLLVEIQNLESLPKSDYHPQVPELLRFKSNPGNEEGEDDHLSESTENIKVQNKDQGFEKISSTYKVLTSDRSRSSETLLLSNRSTQPSSKPLIQIEKKGSSPSSPHLSLADLAKQSKVSYTDKEHCGLGKIASVNLSSLSTKSKLDSTGDSLSHIKKPEKSQMSLADLAKQHSGGGGVSLPKAIKSIGNDLSTPSKDLNQKSGVANGPSFNISLSELANRHKSNLHSLGDLKIGLQPNTNVQSIKPTSSHPSSSSSGKTNLKNDLTQKSLLHSAEQSMGKLSLVSCLKNTKQPSRVAVRQEHSNLDDVDEYLFEFGLEEQVKETVSSPTMDMSDLSLILSQPSCCGIVLCQAGNDRIDTVFAVGRKRKIKYPRFLCQQQVKKHHVMYPDPSLHRINPFTFSTPSPDDIVKSKQKRAFERSDKNFKLGGIS